MLQSLKEKILTTITVHPKLVTLGIGLVTTFSISIVLGATDFQQAHAILAPPCNY